MSEIRMNRVQQQPVEPDTPQEEERRRVDSAADPLPPPRPRRSDEARPAEERHGGETPSGVAAQQ
jgi:hypothetical protein